jgi:hypothetical protein
MQFLDAILDVAPCAVDLRVQPFGGLAEIRHDEAWVVPGREAL